MRPHDTDWQAAACRDHDPELFFPIGDSGPALRQVAVAKAVCSGCALVAPCGDWAARLNIPDGIWGGRTAAERRHERRFLRTREALR